MPVILSHILNPFGWQPEEYEPPIKPTHIHDMMCDCQSKRCFGYTSTRWRKLLSGDVS